MVCMIRCWRTADPVTDHRVRGEEESIKFAAGQLCVNWKCLKLKVAVNFEDL